MEIEKGTIGWAVKQLANGARVRRMGWNGKHQWLLLQLPDGNSKMTEPYVYMEVQNPSEKLRRIPWLCSQSDLLAADWISTRES